MPPPLIQTRAPTNVVVFLDFDGVTHPEPCFQDNVFCRLHLIEEVVRKFSTVEIVISSAWRDHYTLDELRQHFSTDLRTLVVSVTPSLKNPSPVRPSVSAPAAAHEHEIDAWLAASRPAEHEREWEIETWLMANRPPGTPWLAIDDRPNEFTLHNPNLLVTDAVCGFHPSQQRTLRLMLQQRENEL